MVSSSSLHIKMLARLGDIGFPILHPSTCLYNLPLKLNTVPFVTLSRRRLKIACETIWGSLCCFYIWSKLWFMVSSEGTKVTLFYTNFKDHLILVIYLFTIVL